MEPDAPGTEVVARFRLNYWLPILFGGAAGTLLAAVTMLRLRIGVPMALVWLAAGFIGGALAVTLLKWCSNTGLKWCIITRPGVMASKSLPEALTGWEPTKRERGLLKQLKDECERDDPELFWGFRSIRMSRRRKYALDHAEFLARIKFRRRKFLIAVKRWLLRIGQAMNLLMPSAQFLVPGWGFIFPRTRSDANSDRTEETK